MAIFFDSFAKAADYFGGVISPQRLGQLADAQQLRTQEVASGHGGPRRRGEFHEDVAAHLERGDKLDAQDCPCWRVAYAKALGNNMLPASDVVERVQETLDIERAEWAKEREYLHAARRLVQSDIEGLQQEVEELRQVIANFELARTARRGIRGSPDYPRRGGRAAFRPAPQYAGYISITRESHYRYAVDVDGYPLYIAVGEPEGVDDDAYDPGAEFLVDGQLMIKTLAFGVFKVTDRPQAVPPEDRLPNQAASEEPT